MGYIYFLGLKLNYKKEFIAPSIISSGTDYIKVKDIKYTFLPFRFNTLVYSLWYCYAIDIYIYNILVKRLSTEDC